MCHMGSHPRTRGRGAWGGPAPTRGRSAFKGMEHRVGSGATTPAAAHVTLATPDGASDQTRGTPRAAASRVPDQTRGVPSGVWRSVCGKCLGLAYLSRFLALLFADLLFLTFGSSLFFFSFLFSFFFGPLLLFPLFLLFLTLLRDKPTQHLLFPSTGTSICGRKQVLPSAA